MKATRRQRGYALITILFMAAVLLVMLGAVVPRVLTQGRREKEEELIFRGEQYARAVRLYYRKYGRFPVELDDLVKVNNNVRFLRKLYPDPMNPDGHWRLIRVGPGGVLTGNVVERPPIKVPPLAPAVRPATPPGGMEMPEPQPQPQPPAPPPQPPQQKPGTRPPEGQTEQPNRWLIPGMTSQPATETPSPEAEPPQGETPTVQRPVVPGFGPPPKGGATPPTETPPEQASPIPGLPPQTAPGKPPKQVPVPEQPPGFNPEEGGGAPEPQVPEEQPPQEQPPPQEQAQHPTQPQQPPTGAGAGAPSGQAPTTPVSEAEPQVFGAGIVGVASNSTRASIRLYKGHTQYNEWEFLYDPGAELAGVALIPGQAGTQPGAQGPGPGLSPAPPGFRPFGPPSKR